jgi:hypothetical protein
LGQSPKDSIDACIKSASIRIVAEHGFEALNVHAICDLAGASEEDFHIRWPDAWAALLDAFDEQTRLPMLPDTGNLLDDLVIYVLDHVKLAGDATFRMFMFRLLAEMKVRADLRKRFEPDFVDRRARNLILIDRAIARGELPADVDGDAVLDAVLGLGISLLGNGLPSHELEVRRAVEQVIARARNLGASVSATAAEAPVTSVYRLFLFETRGRPSAKAQALECHSDAEAIAEADLRRGGRYAELWKEDWLLQLFEPE